MNDLRARAAQVVAAVVDGRQSLGRELARQEAPVDGRDRALLRELCYGSLRWQPQLDTLVGQLLAKPFKRKDADLRQLLVVGAYQLLYMRIPEHAAIGASVEACRALGKGWATGLVNGVLRNIQRRGSELIEQLPAAARQAHPTWLWQRIHSDWPDHAATIVASNNDYPPMCLRVNRRQLDRAGYLDQLQAADLAGDPCALAPEAIRLRTPVDVSALPGFAAGAVSVQDEAAQLAAQLLGAQPGERVLDACCAPGGKTGHLLERTPGLAALVALDSDAVRLQRVDANLRRLQLSATLQHGDAGEPASWWDGQPFDRILLDAPCSGSGVIRRHPDIKVLRTPADIAALAQLQRRLLDALWPLLARGGTLLYATCSILAAENSDVVGAFVAAHADARPQPMPDWGVPQAVGRQLLPAPGAADGFYYALLHKC